SGDNSMSLSIHTNFASLVTQNTLNKNNSLLSTAMQRLGTGLRINSAADDAAGLQIATRLSAQSRGMAVAMRNTNDAVSMLQTAEGAFNEMTDILQRMKDLATQGANGTNTDDDLTAIQAEYDQLGVEIANIMDNTKFAGEALFSRDNSAGKFASTVTFQIGASASETLEMDLTATGSDAVETLTTALIAMSATYDAGDATTAGAEITGAANATITAVETALNAVGALRAQFGATINRLNHTHNNLANMKDNTDMAKGRILDADFAA